MVKLTVKEIEETDGVLVFDDSIYEKPYMDGRESVYWHYDHSKSRSIKSIGLLTGLYVGRENAAIPFC